MCANRWAGYEVGCLVCREGVVMRWALRSISRSLKDRRGVTAAEYAILTVGIVITVGAAVVTLIDPNNGAMAQLGTALSSTQTRLINDLPNSR